MTSSTSSTVDTIGVAASERRSKPSLRERLLPRVVDNEYHGSQLAIWLLIPLIAGNLFLAGIHVLLPDSGGQVIATMPLDSYAPNAAGTIVAFIAQWGWKQGLTAALLVVVLLRYRALIPLMLLFLAVEQVGKMVIGGFKPVHTIETPPGAAVTLVMTACALVGFALSLRWKPGAPSR